jgi:hypothetical protein
VRWLGRLKDVSARSKAANADGLGGEEIVEDGPQLIGNFMPSGQIMHEEIGLFKAPNHDQNPQKSPLRLSIKPKNTPSSLPLPLSYAAVPYTCTPPLARRKL